MHFGFNTEYDAFRAEVREFIAQNLPGDIRERSHRGYHETKEDVHAWTKILYKKGWSAPSWPAEYGGTGWSPMQQLIFDEESHAAGAPPRPAASFTLVAPVIYTFGTQAQKDLHLPRILKGDVWWGQGFSEPNSGSDLASLSTSAVPDGDDYIVNGHKIWTTQCHFAEWIFALVRTDKTVKPQKGISFLLIDRSLPGITVRPIISIDEAHSLNEVFFDNVRVPKENLVGEEGMGWSYAKFLLENERAWSAEVPRNKGMYKRLLKLASESLDGGEPLINDPVFAAKIAEAETELLALEFMTLRALSEADQSNVEQWPVGSILHVRGSELQQKLGELMVEALGSHGRVFYPEYESEPGKEYPPGPAMSHGVTSDYLYRRATTIYGGSNEIQRTLIARTTLSAAK
jgi:alkylation response protein AidB-like acyl-CoA dehydrogenase